MTLNHLGIAREISSGLMGCETEGAAMVDGQLREVVNSQAAEIRFIKNLFNKPQKNLVKIKIFF